MPSQPPAHTKGLPSVAAILVNGSPLTPDVLLQLVEVRVEQAVRVASRALLRFSDHEFTLIDGSNFDIASKLEVSFLDGNGTQQKVFVGDITSIGIEQSMTSGHELVVEAFDQIHKLSHDSKPTTYLNQSYGSVITKIAKENGLQPRVDGSLNQPVHEYLAQACTPAAFLDMIAVRTGTEWFIDGTTLNVRKRAKAAVVKEIVFGEDPMKFKARFSGSGQVKEVRVTSWDPASKKHVEATVMTSETVAVNEANGASALRATATKKGV